MSTLAHYIKYNHKRFSQITEEVEMKRILDLAEKLRPVEDEILACKGATIDIMVSGNLMYDSFPPELIKKMSALTNGRG